ncbi:MAG: permease [Bacteriovoracaceae bacterium]|jgi:uncharacterized membrane protein YraQ (UPF0718 family)|nr:permease [Bacteriovoracaceae bacterium]
MEGFIHSLWQYLVMSAPYLILGLLLSGVIYVFMPAHKVQKWLGKKGFSGVIKASLIGVPLPLCSCSVIPTAVTLKKSGASNAATSSFLISTPESGVDSISITYALIDLPMTIIRPIAAFASAFFAGLLQLKFNSEDEKVAEEFVTEPCCGTKDKINFSISLIFKYAFGKLLNDIAGWLSIGIILGALISFLFPESFFLTLGEHGSKLLILLVGIPLYICATASTPIAVSLMLKGLSPGTALLLLLVGPATNISNISVLQKYIGKKGVLINIFSIAFVGVVFSYIVDFFYANYFTLSMESLKASHQHESFSMFENICAVVLIILLLKGVYVENIKPRFVKQKSCCG